MADENVILVGERGAEVQKCWCWCRSAEVLVLVLVQVPEDGELEQMLKDLALWEGDGSIMDVEKCPERWHTVYTHASDNLSSGPYTLSRPGSLLSTMPMPSTNTYTM